MDFLNLEIFCYRRRGRQQSIQNEKVLWGEHVFTGEKSEKDTSRLCPTLQAAEPSF